jgi:hypothetical protein
MQGLGCVSDIIDVGLLVAEQLQVDILIGLRLEGQQQQLVRTTNMAQRRKRRMSRKTQQTDRQTT